MQDQLKEYALNLAQAFMLLFLLIFPQQLGNYLITLLELTETKPYIMIFTVMVGVCGIYYGVMMLFFRKLTSRIDNMILFKYAAVIGFIFWVVADGYFSYIYQQAYYQIDEVIIRRDIVWRDVMFTDLPDYVIYPNFRYAFLACILGMRAVLIGFLTYGLMTETKVPTRSGKVMQRRKLRAKSADDLKAGLHPSIMKQYQNAKNTNDDDA